MSEPTSPTWSHGLIEVRDNGVEVTVAPDEATMSLAVLMGSSDRVLRCFGANLLTIGTYPRAVVYRVVGWDEERNALMLRRYHDV